MIGFFKDDSCGILITGGISKLYVNFCIFPHSQQSPPIKTLEIVF